MKKIENYWVDENNNKWDRDYTTEKQVEIYSKSLINCHDCISCISCRDCISCRYCSDCSYCRDCSDCSYCGDCHDYIEKPLRYVTKIIGSRDDNTIFYYGKTKDGMSLQVVCGCFRGNLEEFEKAVLAKHKDNDEFRNQYLKEIEKVKVLFELN